MRLLGGALVLALIVLAFLAVYFSDFRSDHIRQDPFVTDPVGCGQPPKNLTTRFTDTNIDPVFRAGTIPLFSDTYLGHGALVVRGGKLFYVTVEHVADIALGNCAYYYFPGASFFALSRYSSFLFSEGRWSDSDELAAFQIQGDLLTRLSVEIKAGKIMPLVASYTIPASGSIVAIPNADTGAYTLYAIEQIQRGWFSMVTNGQSGLICGGRSGGPVLVIENGVVTNKTIGAVSAINTSALVNTDDGNHCGYVAYGISY